MLLNDKRGDILKIKDIYHEGTGFVIRKLNMFRNAVSRHSAYIRTIRIRISWDPVDYKPCVWNMQTINLAAAILAVL